MVKQRENYKFIILEPAKTRITQGLCPVCATPKSDWKRRTDWRCCSTKCTEEFQKHCTYFGWPDLRMKAFKRDNFTCVKCGYKAIEKMIKRKMWNGTIIDDKATVSEQLVGDHIIPIALGGDEWDIQNIQTLCLACNKVKTKQDQADIAKLRRIEKLQKGNQLL